MRKVSDDANGHSLVRKVLDTLKPHLDAFVRQRLADVPGARLQPGADIAALFKAMLERWDSVFARPLPRERTYVLELRDWRNRLAHEEPLSGEDACRAADTARLLAKALGAPASVTDKLASFHLGKCGDAIPSTRTPAFLRQLRQWPSRQVPPVQPGLLARSLEGTSEA